MNHKIFYVDVSNLLMRWFSYRDYDDFMIFMNGNIKCHKPIDEIVSEWNRLFAKKPVQYVFLNQGNKQC